MKNSFSENIDINLPKLTERELKVLSGFCNRERFKSIAKRLNYTESTIKSDMRIIYTKLELMNYHFKDRWEMIRDDICPKLKEGKIQPAPDSAKDELLVIPPDIDEFIDEDYEKLVLIPMKDDEDKQPPIYPKPWISRRNFFIIIITVFVLAIIGAYSIFLAVIDTGPEINYLPAETEIVYIENEIIKEITVEVPVTVLAAAQSGPTQTSRVEQIIVTATQPPPTPTDVPAPVLEAGFVFSDNFDLGSDPAWEVIFGEPGMANGKYTVIAPFNEVQTTHFSLLSNLIWDNVSIEFKISDFWRRSSYAAIGAVVIHYDSENGGVGLVFYPSGYGIQFATISQSGEWTMLNSSLVDENINLYSGPNIIRIDVNGENYFVYLNNLLFTSATIKGFNLGQIGLWMKTNYGSGDPKSYAPRFEYITIESLP